MTFPKKGLQRGRSDKKFTTFPKKTSKRGRSHKCTNANAIRYARRLAR